VHKVKALGREILQKPIITRRSLSELEVPKYQEHLTPYWIVEIQ